MTNFSESEERQELRRQVARLASTHPAATRRVKAAQLIVNRRRAKLKSTVPMDPKAARPK